MASFYVAIFFDAENQIAKVSTLDCPNDADAAIVAEATAQGLERVVRFEVWRGGNCVSRGGQPAATGAARKRFRLFPNPRQLGTERRERFVRVTQADRLP